MYFLFCYFKWNFEIWTTSDFLENWVCMVLWSGSWKGLRVRVSVRILTSTSGIDSSQSSTWLSFSLLCILRTFSIANERDCLLLLFEEIFLELGVGWLKDLLDLAVDFVYFCDSGPCWSVLRRRSGQCVHTTPFTWLGQLFNCWFCTNRRLGLIFEFWNRSQTLR